MNDEQQFTFFRGPEDGKPVRFEAWLAAARRDARR
jgi:hypothetical protein